MKAFLLGMIVVLFSTFFDNVNSELTNPVLRAEQALYCDPSNLPDETLLKRREKVLKLYQNYELGDFIEACRKLHFSHYTLTDFLRAHCSNDAESIMTKIDKCKNENIRSQMIYGGGPPSGFDPRSISQDIQVALQNIKDEIAP
ncbi:uncharacterized protein LOC143240102 [Tachypleus tridentatus]|uniref:uncharacterized protein LOC143240102 n=1 Tax=Tachypleus tridentatus TaxID=6853 RepID=UPI003FCFD987